MLIKARELLESACGSGEVDIRSDMHVLSMMPGPSGDACIKGPVLHGDAWFKRGIAPHDGSAEPAMEAYFSLSWQNHELY